MTGAALAFLSVSRLVEFRQHPGTPEAGQLEIAERNIDPVAVAPVEVERVGGVGGGPRLPAVTLHPERQRVALVRIRVEDEQTARPTALDCWPETFSALLRTRQPPFVRFGSVD